MKPAQIYQELKELAEKLNIHVSEENLRQTRVKAQSGLCTVQGQHRFIMDKHKSIHAKIEMLAECLSQMDHEEMYIIPAVRELLKK